MSKHVPTAANELRDQIAEALDAVTMAAAITDSAEPAVAQSTVALVPSPAAFAALVDAAVAKVQPAIAHLDAGRLRAIERAEETERGIGVAIAKYSAAKERAEQAEDSIQRVSSYLDALIANGCGATHDSLRGLRSVLPPGDGQELDPGTRRDLLWDLVERGDALNAP